MSKTVLPSHIVAERGVNAFADYCNRHQPYIIWREETKNDFGIDGEVELTELTVDGKTRPMSQILKIQVKSTEHDNSYITRETDEAFFFNASDADMEYWKNYKQYGYEVLLVLFDGRKGNDRLYCKQITNIDIALTTKKGKQKTQPIEFSKTGNQLIVGQNEFSSQYKASFKSRIDHFSSEVLDTNLWPFKSEPRWIYTYPTHYKTKKDIFSKIESGIAPYFIIKNSVIYTFVQIEKDFRKFFQHVVSEGQKRSEHRFIEICASVILRNYYVELLNEYIRDFMRRRGLDWQRDYKRYYFFLKDDQQELRVPYRTRRIGKDTDKSVVNYYEYGKDHFFRHWAVEVKPLFVEDKLYLVISHKYLFTSDKRLPLKPDKITKYTNYINSRTFNDGVLDELHFWWYHLTKHGNELTIFDGTNVNQTSITVGKALSFDVKFGIPLDGNKLLSKNKNSMITEPFIQLPLFS